MQTTDFHKRYHHVHYIWCAQVHVQVNGDIEVHSGNVCMIMAPDELQAMVEGIKDLSRVYAALHRGDTRTVVTT